MNSILSRLFNWKKHPKSVFIWAAPLAILGLGTASMMPYAQWRTGNQGWWVYLLIVVAAYLTLWVCLRPVWSQLIKSLNSTR